MEEEIRPVMGNEPEETEVYPEELEEAEPLKNDSELIPSRRDFLLQRDKENEERSLRFEQERSMIAALSAVEDAKKNQRLMNGTIVGTQRVSNPDGSVIVCIVVLSEEEMNTACPMKTLIPFGSMFESNPLDMKTVDKNTEKGRYAYYRRQEQFLVKMVGIKISYVITACESDRNMIICTGSRKAAMEKLKDTYFFGRNPLTKKTDVIKAQILSVGMNSMALTYGGVDFVLQKYRITRRYHPDLRLPVPNSSFKPGELIDVYIYDLEISGRHVALSGDIRPLEMQYFARRSFLAPPGTVTKGVVTEIFREENSDNVRIRLYLPAYDLVGKAVTIPASSFGVAIKSGTEVVFSVVNAEETGFLFGYIKQIIA